MGGSGGGAPERWCASVDPLVRTCRWEDGLIAYRIDSGETFRFDVVVFKILDCLTVGPVPVGDLLALLDRELVDEEPAELLTRLEQAGLASRETGC